MSSPLMSFIDPTGWQLFDFGGRRHFRWNPLDDHWMDRSIEREFSRMAREMDLLNEEMDMSGMPNVERNKMEGHVQFDDRGDLRMRFDTSLFRPEELRVDLEGDRLVVSGRHEESDGGQRMERYFIRIVPLGRDFDTNRIHCQLDHNGDLCICVPHQEALGQSQQQEAIQGSQPMIQGSA